MSILESWLQEIEKPTITYEECSSLKYEDAVVDLLYQMELIHKEWFPHIYYNKDQVRRRLRYRSKVNDVKSIVAKDGQEIVGLISYYRKKDDKKRGKITDVIVKPQYQRLNIGFTLVSMAKKNLKKLGCQDVQLFVATENKKAIQLYKKCNLEPMGIIMEGKL